MQVSHSEFQYQQFQELLVQTLLQPFTENLVGSDSITTGLLASFNESLVLTDVASGFHSDVIADSAVISDLLSQKVRLSFSDSLVVGESSSLTAGPPTDVVTPSDSGVISDSLSRILTIHFTDSLVGSDLLSTAASANVVGLPSNISIGQFVWRSGLLPFHVDQHAPEGNGQHVSFYFPGTPEPLAYQTLGALGSSTFKPQGYQAINTSTGSVTVSFTDSLVGSDGLSEVVTLHETDSLVASDSAQIFPQALGETGVIQDTATLAVTQHFTESAVVQDSVLGAKLAPNTQSTVVGDSLGTTITVQFTEGLVGSDLLGVSGGHEVTNQDLYFTMQINVEQLEFDFYTVKPEVELAFTDDSYTVQMSILQNTLVAVTDATATGNVFQPTLMVNGQVIYQSAANPALVNGASGTSVFLKYSASGVTGLDLCQLYNFGFTLDDSGGNFSLTSTKPIGGSYYTLVPINQYDPLVPLLAPIIVDYGLAFPGMQFIFPLYDGFYSGSYFGPSFIPQNLGQNLQFFGLNGSITESGRTISNAARGFTAGGIFGNPLMHRQFALLAYNNETFSQLFLGNVPTIIPPAAQNQLTCSVAANMIVNVVNYYSQIQGYGTIALAWAVQDAPYFDTVAQAGETALEAIASLAQRCGGVLRWNGNNNYVVSYPDIGYGIFKVPDCHLISAGGIQEEYLLDLGTGRSGTGVVAIPSWEQNDNGKNNLPTDPNKGGVPTVSQIAKITKVMTTDDPDSVFDLPQDFDQVYIQFLVPVGGDTSGRAPIANESWVTTDPTQWFVFDVASLIGGTGQLTEYVFFTNIGGRIIPQVRVNSSVFPPGNTSIEAGHFVLSLACTRRDLSEAFAQSQNDMLDYQKALAAYNVKNYQFVKTYSGTINCMFFGAVPLPGMIGSATVDDLTVSGVIESVSFQYPGFITIQVARYLRLDMLKPPFLWNSTAGQPIVGGTPKSYGP